MFANYNYTMFALYGIAGSGILFLMYLFRRWLILAVMPPLIAIAAYFVVHGFRLRH